MNLKSKTVRIVGFAAALATTGTLVAFATGSTGAYFTSSQSGTINASTGKVLVGVDQTTLDFTGLLPGKYQDQPVTYQNNGTGNEDIWLVFPMTDAAGNNPSEAFTGNPSDSAGGGLGRYGHFALTSTGGAHFTSYNLNNPGTPGSSHDGPVCATDGNGWGGSNQQPAFPKDTSVPFCAPKAAILLQANLAPTAAGHATLTFGFTPLLTDQNQYAALTGIVNYKIVATQPGIRPDNPFN